MVGSVGMSGSVFRSLSAVYPVLVSLSNPISVLSGAAGSDRYAARMPSPLLTSLLNSEHVNTEHRTPYHYIQNTERSETARRSAARRARPCDIATSDVKFPHVSHRCIRPRLQFEYPDSEYTVLELMRRPTGPTEALGLWVELGDLTHESSLGDQM